MSRCFASGLAVQRLTVLCCVLTPCNESPKNLFLIPAQTLTSFFLTHAETVAYYTANTSGKTWQWKLCCWFKWSGTLIISLFAEVKVIQCESLSHQGSWPDTEGFLRWKLHHHLHLWLTRGGIHRAVTWHRPNLEHLKNVFPCASQLSTYLRIIGT